MRFILGLLALTIILGSCVPAKKYNDLVAKEKNCQDELKKYKTSALDNEANVKTLQKRSTLMKKNIEQLKSDTSDLGQKYRLNKSKYNKVLADNKMMESQIEHIKDSDAKQLARMRSNLEEKMIETQRKEDELLALEKELKDKQITLDKRQQRVAELEEIIARQDQAVQEIKSKISQALRGFEDKGLTIKEKNGKIYVSLEAKLLFASGSTKVESNGKKAVIQLAKAVQDEKQLEIIVEGHTDDDPLKSASHPKDNWELSVLRATSVVEIMIDNSSLDAGRLAASGRSKYHPVDPANKAKNRRIEVIISPNLDELYKMIGE